MFFHALEVGPFAANCYIIGCSETNEALVIDPGGSGQEIVNIINTHQLNVKYIINTHGHIDHIGANGQVKDATGAAILIHKDDAGMLRDSKNNLGWMIGKGQGLPPADGLLEDGQCLTVGKMVLQVLHTPGHTLGGICLLLNDMVFTGDTLFKGSVGRSDFPGGSHQQLIQSINDKLLVLAPNTKVYPGHGPATTIGAEKATNPFLTE